jgi:hypothetical protein
VKIKTYSLIGAALDWAVAKCEGHHLPPMDEYKDAWLIARRFSADWEKGGPIIAREFINLDGIEPGRWAASGYFEGIEQIVYEGPTPLVAAMRCYVASKMGYEVEVPETLL